MCADVCVFSEQISIRQQMTDFSTCWDFAARGVCPRGASCKWAHNTSAAMPVGESQLCWNFQRTGHCPRGAQCRWIHELVLMPWPSPSMVPMAAPMSFEVDQPFPSTPEAYWDQFDENRRLFATTSTYDPSMSAYTTPLAMDSLTAAQIAKADELSRIPLPSEAANAAGLAKPCQYCHIDLSSMEAVAAHLKASLSLPSRVATDKCSEEGTKALKSVLRRKSWIVVQETLPNGLVSQVESLYKRQITSSTNLQMIIDAIVAAEDVAEDTREYLITELICLVVPLLASSHDAKPLATEKHGKHQHHQTHRRVVS